MRLLVILCLLVTPLAISAERSAATLLRVSIDSEIADKKHITSFEFETVLIEALRNAGFDNIDLTPLHDDFQKLRYDANLCAVVGGDSSAEDCAQFGNYAEAVLRVLSNIRLARSAQQLNQLQDQDLIVVMNADIYTIPQRRAVGVDLFYRVYNAGGNRLLAEGKEELDIQIQSRMTEDGAIDRVMYRALNASVASISQKTR